METRANYILIGAFALAGFLGILGFFLWFANIQLDRQFAYYDIDFPTVSGLSDASDVRFSGLPVGQVVDVRLSPKGDGTVRVRVEIGSATPVRTDSVATIEAQGVTGVSYVGISAGTPTSALLSAASPADVPMIDPGQSVLQSLSQDAPEILA
ncbi:MAG: MCE family protein, partial [Rhodobacteraceae bacterium]